MQRNIKVCFTFLSLFCIVILIDYQYKSIFEQNLYKEGVFVTFKSDLDSTKLFNNSKYIINYIPIYNKFITADFRYCGGLGNQLYHMAVYYGIGRLLNRSPFYFANKRCEIGVIKHIKALFSNLPKYVQMFKPNKTESKYVEPIKRCCNLSEFNNVKEKFLIIKNHMPHFYQFFHKFRREILYLMELNPNLKLRVSLLTKTIFKNDNSHKFCIHIRRGDFMNFNYRYQESKASFIIPAAVYIQKFLKKQGHSNISLILLGQDEKFKHTLSFNATLLKRIYYPKFSNREQEFAFGTLNCDTFLLSATASTFAWWIAYLMPEGRNIFYNSQVYKKGDSKNYIFDRIFLPNWNKIDLTL